MALAPKLSNTQVLKQLGKYSFYNKKNLDSFFLLGRSVCNFSTVYTTLNGQLESDHPLHIHH